MVEMMNQVFGRQSWTSKFTSPDIKFETLQDGRTVVAANCVATIVLPNGESHDGVGTSVCVHNDASRAYTTAVGAAASNALKKAIHYLGPMMGLGLGKNNRGNYGRYQTTSSTQARPEEKKVGRTQWN